MFDDVNVISNKLVKTRKKHQCAYCCQFLPKGSMLNRSVLSYDNKIIAIYSCDCRWSNG